MCCCCTAKMGNTQSGTNRMVSSEEHEAQMMQLRRERDLLLLQREVHELRGNMRSTSATTSQNEISSADSDDDLYENAEQVAIEQSNSEVNTSTHSSADIANVSVTTAAADATVANNTSISERERELLSQITQMEQQVVDLRQQIEAMVMRVERLRVAEANRVNSATNSSVTTAASTSAVTSAIDMSEVRCFNCSGFGHYQSMCSRPRRPMGSCFRCGQGGHIYRNCPDRPSTSAMNVQANVSEEEENWD